MSSHKCTRVAALVLLRAHGRAGDDMRAAQRDENWADHNSADEDAYSALDGINRSNVQSLGLEWSLDLEGEQSLEATPLAVDGVLYFTGSHAAVYAVDAATGKLKWKFDPQTWKHNPAKLMFMFGINRGAAYADGRVFSGTLDGRLIALDAKTGSLLWSTQTCPRREVRPSRARRARSTARSSSAMQARTPASAATSRPTMPPPAGRSGGFTRRPDRPRRTRGILRWSAPRRPGAASTGKPGPAAAYGTASRSTAELNRIYLATGNAGPYDPDQRSPGNGDNLYTASIVAVDADTGKYLWHYQVNPRDAWDFDSTQQMALADLVIGGKPRKVLMQAPKNGFFYVIGPADREAHLGREARQSHLGGADRRADRTTGGSKGRPL